jgi:hypothetical protein
LLTLETLSVAAAYYTQVSADLLGTIDGLPQIRGLAIPEGIFHRTSGRKYSRKDNFQPAENRSKTAIVANDSRSEIVCPQPHVYPRGRPFPPNWHHDPSTAMSLSDAISSTTSSHSNGDYPYSESWPSLPSTIGQIVQLQQSISYASPYQVPAPATNSFTPRPRPYSTSYPVTSGYAPIPPHLSSLERSNNVQSPVELVRPISNVFHKPVHPQTCMNPDIDEHR